MERHERRRFMMLLAILVIAAVALCLYHAHADHVDLCAQALAIGVVALIAAALPGRRFVPALTPFLPFRAPELTPPPPRA
jgi:hypothetical protein